MNRSVEIHARVEWFTVDLSARDPVGERASAGDAAIGVEIAELRRLNEADAAAIEGPADNEPMTAVTQRELP